MYEQREPSHPDAEVADAVAHGDHGRIPVRGRPADGDKVVHELLLTRSEPGIGGQRDRPRRRISSVLSALLGPVAARVQAAPVFPHFTGLAGGDDAPSQLQQQLFGGGTGQRVGGGAGESFGGAPA